MELGGLLAGADEGAEVDVRRAGVGHGGDAQLAEEVDAVRRDGGAHGDEVVGAEAGELVVVEVVLRLVSITERGSGRHGGMMRTTAAKYSGSCPVARSVRGELGDGMERRLTVVVVADVDELALQVVDDLVEGDDGVLLRGVERPEVDRLSSGLQID